MLVNSLPPAVVELHLVRRLSAFSMNPQIKSIYATRKVIGKNGAEITLHSEIDPAEGEFIHQIISQDTNVSKTLEVGCAYGLSSLHICDALKSRPNPQHTIVDPFQYSDWGGVGISNLEKAGVTFFRLIEEQSEFALPALLREGEATFDLIFIDGWHTFDHTILDCFYATRLLKTGGYLLIDDVAMCSVGRASNYFSLYPCYQVYAALSDTSSLSLKRRTARALLSLSPSSIKKRVIHPAFLNAVSAQAHTRMIALKKIGEDKRSWNWFPNDF
jgi:predicted O-methyltransferase YrrM